MFYVEHCRNLPAGEIATTPSLTARIARTRLTALSVRDLP
jgi:hypothetical protein